MAIFDLPTHTDSCRPRFPRAVLCFITSLKSIESSRPPYGRHRPFSVSGWKCDRLGKTEVVRATSDRPSGPRFFYAICSTLSIYAKTALLLVLLEFICIMNGGASPSRRRRHAIPADFIKLRARKIDHTSSRLIKPSLQQQFILFVQGTRRSTTVRMSRENDD